MNSLRKFMHIVLSLLRQGITPERIACSVAIGFVVGVIPVLGVTTLLCTGIAIALRLNLVAIQAANWVVYPLQIALLIPYYRAGEFLFGAPPLTLAPADIVALFDAGFWNAVSQLWDTTMRAVVAWGLTAVAAVPPLYLALVALLRRAMRRQQIECEVQT